jgi:hypothetical protein
VSRDNLHVALAHPEVRRDELADRHVGLVADGRSSRADEQPSVSLASDLVPNGPWDDTYLDVSGRRVGSNRIRVRRVDWQLRESGLAVSVIGESLSATTIGQTFAFL